MAKGIERYIRMIGVEQIAKRMGMMIADANGMVSRITHGPEHRTRIRPWTERVSFTIYAPPATDEKDVRPYLEDIRENVIAPRASADTLETFSAD